jgi:hypothetical protein
MQHVSSQALSCIGYCVELLVVQVTMKLDGWLLFLVWFDSKLLASTLSGICNVAMASPLTLCGFYDVFAALWVFKEEGSGRYI